jgi:hypothetical protein
MGASLSDRADALNRHLPANTNELQQSLVDEPVFVYAPTRFLRSWIACHYKEFGYAAPPVWLPLAIASRIDHQYAYRRGHGLLEYAPEAAEEIKELWDWYRKQLATKEDTSNEQAKRSA